ncbi:MAG: 5-oxoprolinase/urea amidolyase family protein [Acidimicrobiales bacterium]|nr:5-oxoprolinase/urea amidolyase family protein [Acidimicrobiales bacterium]
MISVIDGGALTSVQDVPGRIGYWHVGVPPNGPMDDLSHRLVNRVLGNAESAAALEITRVGPTLRFDAEAVIAFGGAPMPATRNGEAICPWTPINVAAGDVVAIGSAPVGMRATLGVRGGIAVPVFLGSRSTFLLGGFGGFEGRAVAAGDHLVTGAGVVADAAPLAVGVAPEIGDQWEIGVLVGPHTEPEFLEAGGTEALVRATWEVHFNSARTGVRLIGPKPRWARRDGGDAGLHPSNIHDTGYAFGAVDLTGDMPIILGPDGPSLGGFVCPLTVATAERWKLGQLAPGDRVRFVVWDQARAAAASTARAEWVQHATRRVDPLARPGWNRRLPPGPLVADDAVMARLPASAASPEVTFRQAGDRFLLVEVGPMTLDLELRLWVQALNAWVGAHLHDGVIDATAGVRSLLVQVDGRRLTVASARAEIEAALDEIAATVAGPFRSRIVHLPLSWDDPSTREAIARYMHGVRDDAPWCPWNIEFIRRVNGLDSVDDVHRIVFDASYFVLGLGDVYLGAPVATPLDPRHRLVTTKYNPARTWTPENAVGIGGAYLCIYGMEGPGGYQFVGRTVQVWNTRQRGPHFDQPWLLRTFDQIRWYPVGAEELLDLRVAQSEGALELRIDDDEFSMADYRSFLDEHDASITAFRTSQRAAFQIERAAWAAAGEFDRV